MHVDMQAGTRTCARTHRHEHRWISTGLHIYLAICLPFDPCNHPLIYHSTQQLICPICPSIRLPLSNLQHTYLPIYLSTYPLIYLPIHRSTYLPIYLPIYVPTDLPIYLSIYLLVTCLFVHLPIYLCAYLPIYLLTYLRTSLPTYLPTCLPGPAYLSIHPSTFLSMYLSF